MAKPFSEDLRERMVRAVQAGRSRHEAARIFGVSASCVIKLMQRYEATGECRPSKFGGYKRPILVDHEDQVRALVRAQPDRTVTELWRELTALGIEVGRSSVGRFLQRLQLTFKKKPCAPPSNKGRMSRPRAPLGARCKRPSIRGGLSLSTGAGLQPT
jgi:putative transposase